MLKLDLKRVLAYPLTSAHLTFAHIDGLKISTDNSTLFSKLEVRIIKEALKSESLRTSQLRLLAQVWCRIEHANAM